MATDHRDPLIGISSRPDIAAAEAPAQNPPDLDDVSTGRIARTLFERARRSVALRVGAGALLVGGIIGGLTARGGEDSAPPRSGDIGTVPSIPLKSPEGPSPQTQATIDEILQKVEEGPVLTSIGFRLEGDKILVLRHYHNGEEEEVDYSKIGQNPQEYLDSGVDIIIPPIGSSEPAEILRSLYFRRDLAYCLADEGSGGRKSRKLLSAVYSSTESTGYLRDLDEIKRAGPAIDRCPLTTVSNINVIASGEEGHNVEYDYGFGDQPQPLYRLQAIVVWDRSERDWRFQIIESIATY